VTQVSNLGWYVQRLRRMSAQEVAWRTSDYTRKRAWSRHRVAPGATDRGPGTNVPTLVYPLQFRATLPQGVLDSVPPASRNDLIAAADEILAGRWTVLGVTRHDLAAPDWFLDPVTGRRAPQAMYCFRLDHRDTALTGNIKQVWELSRHHHLTVLAAAFALSGEEKYAERAARHLRSWWAQSPFLSGIHWTSGIELGVRLISWVWMRRLLDGWEGVRSLFDENEEALRQIWWHQRYLAAFRSRGSSANNHVIAEAAGQLVASMAFDWFPESERWAIAAMDLLESELANNTFPSGVNKEMAFDYHGFVAELGLVAAAEAQLAGRPVSERTWSTLCGMLDVIASVVDVRLRAPRHGDSDDGRALMLGCPDANRWADLLALGRLVFGAPGWWPECDPSILSLALASMAGSQLRPERAPHRQSHFPDAGLTLLRTSPGDGSEIWCRCDAGPHGYLSIAAHAHADALAIEVRHDGVDILADPGTYCYNSEPKWRDYFKSTLGHNTVELAHRNQSMSGGPTLWVRHAQTRLLEVQSTEGNLVTSWSAEHDGYESLVPGARHVRTVRLSSQGRRLEITDRILTAGQHPMRLAFHLGPTVQATIHGCTVELSWEAHGGWAAATFDLPERLSWSLVRGSSEPILGWYSPGFGQKEPATTVLGQGVCTGADELITVLEFAGAGSG
jgi:hypothetical protein